MIVSRQKIRERMLALKMENYTEVARAGQLHANTIYNVLDNDNWNSRTVCQIAAALQCSPLDLIEVTGSAQGQN